MILHQHHIVPRHAGGTDQASNMVSLTIEEHAEAHRILYEKYGRWQDEIAWKGLAGMISKQEIIEIMLLKSASKGGRTIANRGGAFLGKKHSEETKKKIADSKLGNTNFRGKKHSADALQKMSSADRTGIKNSQYGTRWITNGIENKKISKNDPIPAGWDFGRK
jgi:hypothetical protein